MTTFTVGTEVMYCHKGDDRRAHVTEVSPTGEVLGLAVIDAAGRIEQGVQKPRLASTPEHRITDGYFRPRV